MDAGAWKRPKTHDKQDTPWLDDGSRLGDTSMQAEELAPCDQYTLQGDVFSRAVRGEIELPYGVDDAVRNLRVIEAMFRSESSGRWEVV